MRHSTASRPRRRKGHAWTLAALTLVAAGAAPVLAQREPSLLDRISSSPIPDPEQRVLVPGETPLTEGMVESAIRFLEWVLDAPLNSQQRRDFQGLLEDGFRKKDAPTIETTREFLKVRDQIFALPLEQRDLLRATAQPALVQQWRTSNDPSGKWALAIYDAAHRPIAPGNPPLTRQVSDAYAETLCFMISEVTGQPAQADARFKEAFAAFLVRQYGSMSGEQQRALAQLPLAWASLRVAYPQMTPEQKIQVRGAWQQILAQIYPPPAQQKQREQAKPAPAPAQRSAAAPQRSAPPARSSDEAYRRAMADLQSRHNTYIQMSNLLTMRHVGNMNMIAIMGGSPYRYSYR